MQITLRIALVLYAVFIFVLITYLLKKERMPEKYSIIWYLFTLTVLLVGLVPGFLEIISSSLGFEALSNFVIGVLIALLTLMCLVLSVMIAGQKKKTTLLIQELSILKKEVEDKNKI